MPDPSLPTQRPPLWQAVMSVVWMLLMVAIAILYPEHRNPALLVVLIGVVVTWKHYQLWRQQRAAPAMQTIREA